MKQIFIFLFTCTAIGMHAGSFISRDGQTITDSTGKVVQLKGVNLGGWLLWEGWIWGGGFTKEADISKNLTTIAGQQSFDSLRWDVWEHFIGEADIKVISELGFNVVRVPFNHRIFEPTDSPHNGWRIMDSLLHWCEKYHVYAILDMHASVNGQSNFFTADPAKPNMWNSEDAKVATINLWKQIAARYANRTIIAGYDLLNEPIPSKKPDLVVMYDRIIKAIREVDQNHMMVIEGGNFAKDFSMFTKLPDNNMLFSFHIYTWFGGKPAEKMAPFVQVRERLDVPMWCGEWGENNYDVVQQTLNAFAAPESKFSGWCFWTWKKHPNGYASLNAINVSTSWKDVITWCGKPNMKKVPPHDAAVAAMREFRKAIRYENCNHDYRLGEMLKADAMNK